jgi:trehalose-6-phosphate synthase
MSDLVIVSNRGPFSFSEAFLEEGQKALKSGKRPDSPEFGAGGLVQAMSGLLKPGKWNTTWIGASMGDRDIEVARGHYTQLFKRMIQEGYAPEYFPHIEIDPDNRMHFRYKDYNFYMRFVFFDTRHMHSYYSKFANGFLWPLMHLTRSPLFYKKGKVFPRPLFEKTDFMQYTSSAVTFANTIIDEIRKSQELRKDGEDIVVWNQDYHLMQIAELYEALLREEGFSEAEKKKIHVGQFMHTPFFNIHEIQGLIREDKRNRVKEQIYDPFGERVESVLQKLIWGMLANDFIGFHTKEYCDHYLEALEEWFPVDIRISGQFYEISHAGSVTTVGAFPIGLDVDHILSEVTDDKKLRYRFKGEDLYNKMRGEKEKGRYVLGGLDRCDYTKGLIERLGIFRHAYNKLKGANREVRFFQVTAPSRSQNPDYQNLRRILEQEVDNVNKTLQDDVVIHMTEGMLPPQNYRFMKEVDAMLVTPLEDGMNLVAFEYILSQKFKRPKDRGLLVLSTSGASRVLKGNGYGEKDGIIYVNPMKTKDGGEKVADALLKGQRLSDKVIEYVEKERRVDDWAEKNIEAILNCKRKP